MSWVPLRSIDLHHDPAANLALLNRSSKNARSVLGSRRGLVITHKKLVNAPAVVLRVSIAVKRTAK